jgi:hypothetical protein
MKKALLSTVAGLLLAAGVNAQSTPLGLSLNVTTTTNVMTQTAPLTLTSAQMAGVISMMEASGISSSVPVSVTNLLSVTVTRQSVPQVSLVTNLVSQIDPVTGNTNNVPIVTSTNMLGTMFLVKINLH